MRSSHTVYQFERQKFLFASNSFLVCSQALIITSPYFTLASIDSSRIQLLVERALAKKKTHHALNLICDVCRDILLRKKSTAQHVKRGSEEKNDCRQYRSAMAADWNMNTNCFLFEFHILFRSLLLFPFNTSRQSTLIASMSLFETYTRKISSFIWTWRLFVLRRSLFSDSLFSRCCCFTSLEGGLKCQVCG